MTSPAYKKDKYRREGKGLRCCLGNRIYSIICHASYFALGRFRRIGGIHPFLQIILEQFILFFKSSYSTKQLARQGIEYILSPKQQRWPLHFPLSLSFFYDPQGAHKGWHHRRRIELEDKVEFILFPKSNKEKQLAQQEIEQSLSPNQTRQPLPCLLILSFFYGWHRRLKILLFFVNWEKMPSSTVDQVS